MSPASPVVATVYLLDDLSGRVAVRGADSGLAPDVVADLVADVRNTTLRAAAAFPLGAVSVELLSWQHVLDSLRVRLGSVASSAEGFDATLVLGEGGARLAVDLAAWGCSLPERHDVAVAKVLDEPDNAFYSPHSIARRDREPLQPPAAPLGRARLLVVDDCVQTGMTFDEVVRVSGVRPGRVVTGLCNEATLRRLEEAGWEVVYGVLLPGPTYPDSYETDLFCVRDFVVEDAVRFSDGSSTSYSSGGDWLEVLYGSSSAASVVADDWQRLTARLRAHGVTP